MEFKKNNLREKIRRGEIALGTALYSFSPALIELAGYTGLDFCRIDNEHAWRQDESGEHMIRAGLLAGICPLMRVDRDNPYLVRKALEAGAGGVIVPHVHDQKDAEAIAVFLSSCLEDLDTVPLDPNVTTSATFYNYPESYEMVLAKLYGGLSLTGQTGPHGNPDILGIDEGLDRKSVV